MPARPALLALWPGAGFVNLEGPVADAVPEGPGVQLANGPTTPRLLAAAGVVAVGVANNHETDADPARTRSALGAASLTVVGPEPVVRDIEGWRVAFVQHDLGPVPNLTALAATQADFKVAAFHVTGPPSYLPRPELQAAVQAALDAGVDVVVGHGTHAIGPVERRGQQIIAWGLGNYVFDCPCTREDEGLVLTVTLAPGRAEAWIHPVRAGLGGQAPAAAPDAEAIFTLLEGLGSSALRRAGARAGF